MVLRPFLGVTIATSKTEQYIPGHIPADPGNQGGCASRRRSTSSNAGKTDAPVEQLCGMKALWRIAQIPLTLTGTELPMFAPLPNSP